MRVEEKDHYTVKIVPFYVVLIGITWGLFLAHWYNIRYRTIFGEINEL